MCMYYPWKRPIWIVWFKLKRRSPKWSTLTKSLIVLRSSARYTLSKYSTASQGIWRPNASLMVSSCSTPAGWSCHMKRSGPSWQAWTLLRLRRRTLNSSRILHIWTFQTIKSTCTTWWIWYRFRSLTCSTTRWILCNWFLTASRIYIRFTFRTIRFHLVIWRRLGISIPCKFWTLDQTTFAHFLQILASSTVSKSWISVQITSLQSQP